MRILIVEDDESRCAWFQEKFAGCDVDLTCTVGKAFEWLAEFDYDVILLDHDLIEEHYFSDIEDDERTGYAVAAWLATHPDRQHTATIIVHSLNYVGAERMLEVLREAGRDAVHVPFPYLQTGLRF
jgi:CheY-like chemotaxis protein